jgi:Tol biopolymer transport system component
VFVIGADGSGERKIAEAVDFGQQIEPQWSPDDQWIALVRDSNLCLVRPTGADLKKLTDYRQQGGALPTVTASYFAWSPTGSQLAFVKHQYSITLVSYKQQREIWIVNADGTGLRRLVPWAGSSYELSWR